jgi:hypothetical protein
MVSRAGLELINDIDSTQVIDSEIRWSRMSRGVHGFIVAVRTVIPHRKPILGLTHKGFYAGFLRNESRGKRSV